MHFAFVDSELLNLSDSVIQESEALTFSGNTLRAAADEVKYIIILEGGLVHPRCAALGCLGSACSAGKAGLAATLAAVLAVAFFDKGKFSSAGKSEKGQENDQLAKHDEESLMRITKK